MARRARNPARISAMSASPARQNSASGSQDPPVTLEPATTRSAAARPAALALAGLCGTGVAGAA
jgi:hypothetical protein